MKKVITMALAMVLVAVCAVGGTLAWLTDTTETVTNTFTVGDIDITLLEHALKDDGTLNTDVDPVTENDDYKIIPGYTLNKDPYVTVKGGSEACYVFVEVTENITPADPQAPVNFTDYLPYTVDTTAGWQQLTGVDGVNNVWYQEVDAAQTDTVINILTDKKIVVPNTLTKEALEKIEAGTKPTLSFKAYAHQLASNEEDGEFTAINAWNQVSAQS